MNRRSFLSGAAVLLAAPSIVRVSSIMPVYAPRPEYFILARSPPPFDLGEGRLTGAGYWMIGERHLDGLLRIGIADDRAVDLLAAGYRGRLLGVDWIADQRELV
jgi:hypothetical protein